MSSIASIGAGADALRSGQLGLRRSFDSLNRDAATIARGGAGSAEVTQALAHLSQDRLLAKLSARVLSTADEMLGTLIDIHV